MPNAPIVMCQISNGHISATGELIHFMFRSRVGFSRLADQMVPFPVQSNPGRPSSWKITAALCSFPVTAQPSCCISQHRPLTNSRFNCEPSTLRLGCTNTADRVLSFLVSVAWSAVTKAVIGWVNQRQHTNRHMLRDHSLAVVVECRLKLLYDYTWNDPALMRTSVCPNKVGLILVRMTLRCANTFPGSKSKVLFPL